MLPQPSPYHSELGALDHGQTVASTVRRGHLETPYGVLIDFPRCHGTAEAASICLVLAQEAQRSSMSQSPPFASTRAAISQQSYGLSIISEHTPKALAEGLSQPASPYYRTVSGPEQSRFQSFPVSVFEP